MSQLSITFSDGETIEAFQAALGPAIAGHYNVGIQQDGHAPIETEGGSWMPTDYQLMGSTPDGLIVLRVDHEGMATDIQDLIPWHRINRVHIY